MFYLAHRLLKGHTAGLMQFARLPFPPSGQLRARRELQAVPGKRRRWRSRGLVRWPSQLTIIGKPDYGERQKYHSKHRGNNEHDRPRRHAIRLMVNFRHGGLGSEKPLE